MRLAGSAATVVAVLVLAAAQGCGGGARTGEEDAPRRIRVPQDAPTISAAVDRAEPGDIVLVAAGVYHEMVRVKTPRVTVRGLDRNTVIIDGDLRRPNGIVLSGAGDAVQNLTVRNAVLNGVLITGDGEAGGRAGAGYGRRASSAPVEGFLVDRVTSYNNGLYGIYAFGARDGVIKRSYTSGMADSGIYVGQCKPCNIAVRANVAERNAVGYEATNASRRMYVHGNRFVGNRVGVAVTANRQEDLLPQERSLLAGNLIASNNERATPEQAEGGFGIGVGIAGGRANTVLVNRIVANTTAGLEITNAGDLPPLDNRVVRNVFARNGVDIVYASAQAPGSGNCLLDNTLTTVRPADLPRCPATGAASVGVRAPAPRAPRGVAFTDVPAPPRLPSMPTAATAAPPQVPPAIAAPDVSVAPSVRLLQDESAIRW